MAEEKVLQRWGGLAGMIGAIVFVIVVVLLVVLVPVDPTDPEAAVMSFPSVRMATAIGEGLFLAAVILWVPFFLALDRTLRVTSFAPALVGRFLSFMGLTMFAVGALPHLAFTEISDLYHDPGATAGERANLVLVWQAIQGVFNETDTVGFILLNVGFIVLGLAMPKAPGFGKGFGGVSVAFGVVGVVWIAIVPVDSLLIFPAVILAFIVFPLLFGWKVYQKSRAA